MADSCHETPRSRIASPFDRLGYQHSESPLANGGRSRNVVRSGSRATKGRLPAGRSLDTRAG